MSKRNHQSISRNGNNDNVSVTGENADIDVFTNFLKDPKELSVCLKKTLESSNWSLQHPLVIKLNETIRCLLKSLTSTCDKENVDNNVSGITDNSEASCCLLSVIGEFIQALTCDPPAVLQQIIFMLYGSFNLIQNDKVKNSVAHLCELWWIKDFDGKNEVVRDVIFYLLQKAINKNLKINVKRCLKMVEYLHCVDHTDVEKKLLLDCSVSSLFLNAAEGRRFIAALFQINAEFLRQLHQAVKIKLVSCNDKEAGFYGEIYYNAWRLSDGKEIRTVMEESCIQNLIFHCIHASKSHLAHVIRKVLGHFNNLRLQSVVRKMLFRLYEPILWSSLKVANDYVRANAALLVFAVFPLLDPDDASDEEMKRQLFDIETLLMDPYHEVRRIAICGVCRICNEYWDTINVTSCKKLLMPIVETLAFDASSVNVRVAVFKGFAFLLENVLCHGLMKELLRPLEKSLFDVSEKVRLAYLDMLLTIKRRRTIKYWDVVSPDDLLVCLEEASSSVASRIVSLLKDAYNPAKGDDNLLLERNICLIKDNPMAARTFFHQLYHLSDLDSVVRHILIIHSYLRLQAKSQFAKEMKDRELEFYEDPNDSDVSDGDEKERDTTVDIAPNLIKGLIEAICVMWMTIKADLEKESNSRLKLMLQNRFSLTMTKFYKVFRDTVAFKPLVYLSSFVLASKVPNAVSYCRSKLNSLTSDSSEDDYCIILESLCNWGRGEEIIEVINRWLQSAYVINTTPVSNKKRRSAKTVKFQDDSEPQPVLALDIFSFMMNNPSCRNSLLNKSRLSLVDLLNILNKFQKLMDMSIHDKGSLPNVNISDEFLCRIFFMTFELTFLLHDANVEPMVDVVGYMSRLINWAEDKILPQLGSIRPSMQNSFDTNYTDSLFNLPWKIIISLVKQLSFILLANVADMTLAARISNFFGTVLLNENLVLNAESNELLESILKATWRLQEICVVNNETEHPIYLNAIPDLVRLLIKGLKAISTDHKDRLTRLIPTLKPIFAKLLVNSQEREGLKSALQDFQLLI